MRRKIRRASALLCGAIIVGCQRVEKRTVAEAEPAIRTAKNGYSIGADSGQADTIVAYFTNRTEAPVFILHCNGAFSLSFEKLDRGTFSRVWTPSMDGCLSNPMIVPSSGARVDTFVVSAARTPELGSGSYRIVYHGVLQSFQRDSHPFGPELPEELRRSNVFTVQRR